MLNTTVVDRSAVIGRSRLKPGFKMPAHRSNMPQINMIPHPVTLYSHQAN